MKNVFRNSIFSVADTCWAGLSLFLLFRYVAAHLGVAAIGAWSLLIATMSISSVADVGVGRALLHFVPTAVAQDKPRDAAQYVETAVIVVGLLFFFVLLVAAPIFAWAIRAFVVSSERGIVLQMLPYALFSLWLSNIALVFLSGLAGMQRYDLRSVVSICGSTTQLATAILTIRSAGLMGLIWAQMAQNLVVLVCAAILLRRALPSLSIVKPRFSLGHFKTMRKYGTSLQLYNLVAFIFEPSTKFMLSHFGGLSMLGFYEMASRMANQVRSLVVNAIQVLVPALAEMNEQAPDRAMQSYLRMSQVIWIIACPTMGFLAICLPFISILWLGRQSHEFIVFSLIVISGWTVNLASVPAFFMGLATGYLRWNLRGVFLASSMNLILGTFLGYSLGAIGVVISFAASLASGSLILLYFNHRRFGGNLRQLFNVALLRMLILLIGAVALGNFAFDACRSRIGVAGCLGVSALAITIAIWLSLATNPATASFLGLLRVKYRTYRGRS